MTLIASRNVKPGRRRVSPPATASPSSREAASPQTLWVALDWIERHCVIPDGFRKGAPFTLYLYQGEYLRNFYLVKPDAPWVPENPVLAPAFVHRRGLMVGPQKVGKNPMIATQVCLEGVGPALFAGFAGVDEGYVCRENGCRCGWEYPYRLGEPRGMAWPTPLIQITAFSEDSTENTYDALRPMIDDGPLHDVIPKTGEEFIRLPGGGRIDTVTSSNQSRLGQRVTFVPQDELGLWTAQNKMVKLADTQYRGLAGMGGRASLTSNAWDPAEQSVAQQQFESVAQDIYRQFVQPPANLSYANKRDRHKMHQVVYPEDVRRENGGHLDLDSIEAEAADLAAKDLSQAARFFGNKLMAGAGAALEPEQWDRLARTRGLPNKGTHVGLGFDGSDYRDDTALRGCTADGYRFTVGHWHPTPEHPISHTEVTEKVRWAFGYFNVGRLECDPARWKSDIETWTLEFGNDANGDPRVVVIDTNQERRFAPVVDRWLMATTQGTHPHDGDPNARAHVLAAHKRKARQRDPDDDDRTLYVLVKGGDKRPIDLAIADALAVDAAALMGPAKRERPALFVGST